ncbi:MAG: sigma-54 dependent transcriptional regulator [Fibrobacteria bacterium]
MRSSFSLPRRVPLASKAAALSVSGPSSALPASPDLSAASKASPPLFWHGMIHAPGSPLEAVLRLAGAAARRECPVHVRGESGTGKEMLAQFLHTRSPRASGPFVAVNCAALPPGLIESELFGHRKGAFTGAVADSPGRFRQADGGTLFLDEIGDMPLEVQSRMLRTLQEKRVAPVGDGREYPVDFRLVSATHRDLRTAVRAGRFREDLFYRLNVLEISLPPLRERPGDILPLLRYFLSALLPPDQADSALGELSQIPASTTAITPMLSGTSHASASVTGTDTSVPPLASLPFPGNIRELRNLAERYCILREMGEGWTEAVTQTLPVAVEKCPIPGSKANPVRIRNSRRSDGEILHALDVCGNHRERASDYLGISRRALQYRLARMGPFIPSGIAP